MGGLNRSLVQTGEGDRRGARPGDGWLAGIAAKINATDSNQVIDASAIANGLVIRTVTANRTDTTDTGANLAAAFPQMDIGDTMPFMISSSAAFTITAAGGTGVTASGNLVTAANSAKWYLLVKTGAATFNLIGL